VARAEAYLHAKFHLDPSSRLVTLDMGRKLARGLCPFLGRGAGSPSNKVAWAEDVYLHTKLPIGILIHPAVWPHRTWAENGGLRPTLWGGELGPHPAQSRLGRGLPRTKWHLNWSIQRFGRNRHGPKLGAVPLGEGSWVPCNTMWPLPGPRPTCVPGFIFLIHPTVRPQCTNVTDRTDRQDRTITVAQKYCTLTLGI